MRILVTGGAGFIGSAVTRHIIKHTDDEVCVLDKLTYAGNLDSLAPVAADPRYSFVRADICDRKAVDRVFADFAPDAVMHLAAESHVDRSIDGPAAFIETNVVGTFTMLEAALAYWRSLDAAKKEGFRFLHISTDEVFGSLGREGLLSRRHALCAELALFGVESRVRPSCARLARDLRSADRHDELLEQLWSLPLPGEAHPSDDPECARGQAASRLRTRRKLRDWLFVDDHAEALTFVVRKGLIGQSYNVGGRNEKRNIDVVESICSILDEVRPQAGRSHKDLITFVTDRPGHDARYAIDCTKIERELGWAPKETFESGLRKTVQWYIDNPEWWGAIRSGKYRGERLGRIG